MMKAAEATDSLRANKTSGKFADNLSCNERGLPLDGFDVLSDKNVKRGGESISGAASTTRCSRLPSSRAESKKERPWAPVVHPDADARRDEVLRNLLQTGCIKSKRASLASVASMERRGRCCSCSELSTPSINTVMDLDRCSNGDPSNSSCNCNMENCAWVPTNPCSEEAFPTSVKSQSWRSSSDQFNSNASLHRALAAMKKVSGEPDAVKKSKPRGPPDRSSILSVACEIESNGRSITNSDARTLSMRERGRWGNSKMQQQLFGTTVPPHLPCTTSGQIMKPNLGSDHHHHHQALQHVQCLHCGSFSTTPASSASRGMRSHSFGRRVRDYSWQQELQQEQKRPEQHVKEVVGSRPLSQNGRATSQNGRWPDEVPEYASGAPGMKLQHQGGIMSWQERYMLLCQAIAAGAFVDAPLDDSSGPIMAPSRGYSWAVCECKACEMCGEGTFRCAAPANYCSTSSGERMMELEAFSGPLGYVSEYKGTELSGILEKRVARRGISRWWARLPSFRKAKSSSNAQGGEQKSTRVAGQNTAQCSVCGQRVWARGEEEADIRHCPDCLERAGGAASDASPSAAPTTRSSAARPRPSQPPPFMNFASNHHKNLPRRWRLMKLCRYLMGFPLQR